MQKKRVNRSEDLQMALQAELSDMPYGHKLPSVRDLLERFRVGRSVLDGVLDELERRDVIRRVPYVGIFNNIKTGNRKMQVTLVTPDWPGEVFFQLGNALEQALVATGRFSFNRVALKEPYFANLPTVAGDILLLVPPSRTLSVQDLVTIQSIDAPSVLMSRYLFDLEQHYTNTLPGYGGDLAAKCFIDHGHSRLAVLISEPPIAEVSIRVTSFCNYAAMHDCEVEVIDCQMHSNESAPGKAYDTLSRYLREKERRFTALFVVSDISAIGALRALHELDVDIPREVSVIGYDGLEQGEFYLPPLTTIQDNRAELAQKLATQICGFVDGEISMIRVEQRPELLMRQSVARVRKN